MLTLETSFDLAKALTSIHGHADWIGLRLVEEIHYHRSARNGKTERNQFQCTRGVMIEAVVRGHLGYAATSDLRPSGIDRAARRAAEMAAVSSSHPVMGHSPSLRPKNKGRYSVPCQSWLDSTSLETLTAHLLEATRRLKVSNVIETTLAELSLIERRTHYVTSSGTDLSQTHYLHHQNFSAIARNGHDAQQRSLNGTTARCFQGGLEDIDWQEIHEACERTGKEALDLLAADNCPEATLDLVLAPDQMLLQIHESIGHPLELDRILGDERNYAGWSFVKAEDFGTLQYGSDCMNVVFDPDLTHEFGSYGFDDGGAAAERHHLIQRGRLLRGLGGLESQERLKVPGVANFRASSWNRAPIDRMANINLEPGTMTFEGLIGGIERGIFMASNRSWSIDDYRNKFQFGCEFARLIEDGRLTRIVKNPNYRGKTLPFWHSLDAVGDQSTFELFGTPFCGKGEPNQMIRVGHAAPASRFRKIDVFGGAQ